VFVFFEASRVQCSTSTDHHTPCLQPPTKQRAKEATAGRRYYFLFRVLARDQRSDSLSAPLLLLSLSLSAQALTDHVLLPIATHITVPVRASLFLNGCRACAIAIFGILLVLNLSASALGSQQHCSTLPRSPLPEKNGELAKQVVRHRGSSTPTNRSHGLVSHRSST
jgi:hypothetical protein